MTTVCFGVVILMHILNILTAVVILLTPTLYSPVYTFPHTNVQRERERERERHVSH